MAMTFDDIMQPGYPHGTPEGFTRGCKSAAACPAKHTHGLDCRSAFTASKSDYTVAKLFKRGFTPAQIAAYLEDGIHPETPALAAVDTTPTPEPAPTPAPAPQPTPTPAKETTMTTTTTTPKPKKSRGPRPKFGSPTSTRATPKPRTANSEASEIRAWAIEKGYEISSRGAIPAHIREHYEQAHATPPATETIPAEAMSSGTLTVDASQMKTGEIQITNGAVTVGEIAFAFDESGAFDLRSDLLDETRVRIAETEPDEAVASPDRVPVAAMMDVWSALVGDVDDFSTFYAEHGHDGTWDDLLQQVRIRQEGLAAKPARPVWGEVAAARDVERARATAVRFEAEWTRETERADTAERALALTLEKWDQSEEDCARLIGEVTAARIRLMLASEQIRHLVRYARRLEDQGDTAHEESESALVDHVQPRRGVDATLAYIDEAVDLLPWQRDLMHDVLASNPTIADGPGDEPRRRPWWIRAAAFFGFAD